MDAAFVAPIRTECCWIHFVMDTAVTLDLPSGRFPSLEVGSVGGSVRTECLYFCELRTGLRMEE